MKLLVYLLELSEKLKSSSWSNPCENHPELPVCVAASKTPARTHKVGSKWFWNSDEKVIEYILKY